MAKKHRGNREAKKPKKRKEKVIAAAPSQKATCKPSIGSSSKRYYQATILLNLR